MKLSDVQIAMVASQAGFRGSDLPIAVAVALAESGGNTDAVNTANSDGSTDRGLFQINSVHSDLLSKGSWSNPNDNARMAYAVWHGSGWAAWSTYNNGKYLLFKSRGTAAAQRLANSGTIPPVAGYSGDHSNNPKNYKGGTDQPNGYAKFHGLIDPGSGKWRHPWHDYKHRNIPDPPVGYSATVPNHYFGKVLTWAIKEETGEPTSTPRPFPVLTPVEIVRVRTWLRAYSPDGISAQQLGAADGNQLSMWYCDILRGQTGFDAGAAIPDKIPVIDQAASVVESLAHLISFLTNPHNWIRIGYFVFGGALVLIAAYKISGMQIPSVAKAVAL